MEEAPVLVADSAAAPVAEEGEPLAEIVDELADATLEPARAADPIEFQEDAPSDALQRLFDSLVRSSAGIRFR